MSVFRAFSSTFLCYLQCLDFWIQDRGILRDLQVAVVDGCIMLYPFGLYPLGFYARLSKALYRRVPIHVYVNVHVKVNNQLHTHIYIYAAYPPVQLIFQKRHANIHTSNHVLIHAIQTLSNTLTCTDGTRVSQHRHNVRSSCSLATLLLPNHISWPLTMVKFVQPKFCKKCNSLGTCNINENKPCIGLNRVSTILPIFGITVHEKDTLLIQKSRFFFRTITEGRTSKNFSKPFLKKPLKPLDVVRILKRAVPTIR